MVNLESAITDGGTRTRRSSRSRPAATGSAPRRPHSTCSPPPVSTWSRWRTTTAPTTGPVGLRGHPAAARRSPIPVVGIGATGGRPSRRTGSRSDGTDFAVLRRRRLTPRGIEQPSGPPARRQPGIAAAHAPRTPRAAPDAVRAASRQDDVVVVYLHWGAELQALPDRAAARAPRGAGGGGRRRRRRQPRPRPARIRVARRHVRRLRPGQLPLVPQPPARHRRPPAHGSEDGRVVSDDWVPARIQRSAAAPAGAARGPRGRRWRDWRSAARLLPASRRRRHEAPLPAYTASVRRIGPALRDTDALQPPARVSRALVGPPLPAAVLRRLRRAAHTSARWWSQPRHARDVVARVRAAVRRAVADPADATGRRLTAGTTTASMAADNTSAFNCRRVAGSDRWSAHAYGAAIDINPVENPVPDRRLGRAPRPGAGSRGVDRSVGRASRPGVIRRGRRRGPGLRRASAGSGAARGRQPGLPALRSAVPLTRDGHGDESGSSPLSKVTSTRSKPLCRWAFA